jgi:hypothetical protein
MKISNNRPDLFILDKKHHEVTLIEVGIIANCLQTIRAEKNGKYDLPAKELGILYRIQEKDNSIYDDVRQGSNEIPWKYLKKSGITRKIEVYIQCKPFGCPI